MSTPNGYLEREELDRFLRDNGDIERVELIYPDLNGVERGKWQPASAATKLIGDGMKLPISTYALNIWGEDVDGTALAHQRGDPDGVGRAIAGTLKRIPWADSPSAQVLMTLEDEHGRPCTYDPRQRLAEVVARFTARGLTPVVATELEFYLFAPRADAGAAPTPPAGLEGAQVYDLSAVETCAAVLREIHRASLAIDVPADAIIAEFGPGQFEINLNHMPDALKAADAAVLFKRIVYGVARRHGFDATFMAKPYGAHAGSGLHAHVSLLDETGRNVFAAETGVGPRLRHAIGGALATMRPMQAVFAPHANSYRRFQPGSYAPTAPIWGENHRGCAIRVPETKGLGARLEHRISGADANPYLALAAILGGMLHGLEHEIDPGEPLQRSPVAPYTRLHHDWWSAVEEFAASEVAAEILGAEYQRVYAAVRFDEIERWSATIGDVEYRTYLTRL